MNFLKLKNRNCMFDVIISITVLQHILEDDELHDVLDMMYEKLNDNGIIILMESFYDEKNSYIRTWNYAEFHDYFLKHVFIWIKCMIFIWKQYTRIRILLHIPIT